MILECVKMERATPLLSLPLPKMVKGRSRAGTIHISSSGTVYRKIEGATRINGDSSYSLLEPSLPAVALFEMGRLWLVRAHDLPSWPIGHCGYGQHGIRPTRATQGGARMRKAQHRCANFPVLGRLITTDQPSRQALASIAPMTA